MAGCRHGQRARTRADVWGEPEGQPAAVEWSAVKVRGRRHRHRDDRALPGGLSAGGPHEEPADDVVMGTWQHQDIDGQVADALREVSFDGQTSERHPVVSGELAVALEFTLDEALGGTLQIEVIEGDVMRREASPGVDEFDGVTGPCVRQGPAGGPTTFPTSVDTDGDGLRVMVGMGCHGFPPATAA